MRLVNPARTRRNAVLKTLTAICLLLFASLLAGAGAVARELASGDKQFLIKAAESGNMEIAASRSARGKAVSNAVKSFAEAMENDHLKLIDELTHLAADKGAQVPDEPSKEQQARLGRLNGLEKLDFDREFVKDMGIAAHKDALSLFRKSAADAHDKDVRAFAAKTLPTLEHHLRMAESLNTSMTQQ